MESTTQRPSLQFRPPSTSSARPSAFTPPAEELLHGKWHVTHSTLPMWKSNCNVTITYTPVASRPGCLDDLVEYQSLGSRKYKTVNGVDTPDSTIPGAYNWRGNGWLKIASSHWEVLGYGHEDGGWVVTFFNKTLFTPAGIDIYARTSGGLSHELVDHIRTEMKNVDDISFQQQADQIFEIQHDWLKS